MGCDDTEEKEKKLLQRHVFLSCTIGDDAVVRREVAGSLSNTNVGIYNTHFLHFRTRPTPDTTSCLVMPHMFVWDGLLLTVMRVLGRVWSFLIFLAV